MKNIIIKNANANNLKNINAVIKFNELTVCVGVSGSGKTSFAFETIINNNNCTVLNKPNNTFFKR